MGPSVRDYEVNSQISKGQSRVRVPLENFQRFTGYDKRKATNHLFAANNLLLSPGQGYPQTLSQPFPWLNQTVRMEPSMDQ